MSGLSRHRPVTVPIQHEDTVLTVLRRKPNNGEKMRKRYRYKRNKCIEIFEEVTALTVAVFVVCFK